MSISRNFSTSKWLKRREVENSSVPFVLNVLEVCIRSVITRDAVPLSLCRDFWQMFWYQVLTIEGDFSTSNCPTSYWTLKKDKFLLL